MAETSSNMYYTPPIREWKVCGGKWTSNDCLLCQSNNWNEPLLESPSIIFEPDLYHIIKIEYETIEETHATLKVVDSKRRVIYERQQKACGTLVCLVGIFVKKKSEFNLHLYNEPLESKSTYLNNFKINRFSYRPFQFKGLHYDTCMSHWGIVKKSIHKLCKNSKHLNCFVSFLEMLLGRTEILSLPSFLSLCPTGRCNANCQFCSVAENRHGIDKGTIPKQTIEKLIYQIGKTIWMFGIEGNGEPLMYKYFTQLLATIISINSKAYLITNGSLLTDNICYLLASERMDSINFSLNFV